MHIWGGWAVEFHCFSAEFHSKTKGNRHYYTQSPATQHSTSTTPVPFPSPVPAQPSSTPVQAPMQPQSNPIPISALKQWLPSPSPSPSHARFRLGQSMECFIVLCSPDPGTASITASEVLEGPPKGPPCSSFGLSDPVKPGNLHMIEIGLLQTIQMAPPLTCFKPKLEAPTIQSPLPLPLSQSLPLPSLSHTHVKLCKSMIPMSSTTHPLDMSSLKDILDTSGGLELQKKLHMSAITLCHLDGIHCGFPWHYCCLCR